MTSKNNLNAGAMSFTPTVGGESSPSAAAAAAPPQGTGARGDSFSEYAEMMENLEDAMEDTGHGSSHPVAVAAPPQAAAAAAATNTTLPPHLQKHAQEFWFPESRDCTCCKGFKHGCRCAPSNYGICFACSGPGNPSNTYNNNNSPACIPATTAAAPMPTTYGGGRGAYSGGGGRGGRGRGGGGRGGGGRVPCRFFISPAGCRYGDSCTFSHQQ